MTATTSDLQRQPDPRCCRDCRHWHAAPVDPADLAAPRLGECREGLHLVVLPAGVSITRGMPSVQLAPLYARTPGDFPACGRFSQR